MKIPTLYTVFLSLTWAAFSLSASETWTNREGNTMTAELKAVEGEHAIFVRGKESYKYPLANLSDDDQKRARELGEKKAESEKEAAMAKALNGQLVRMDRRGPAAEPADALKNKKLFAFYYSAGWCPPCRKFTPDLVSFYDQVKESHPEFEVVFVSSDRDKKAMDKYMKDYNMSFPAVKYDSRDLDVVKQYKERGIPNLVFLDGDGAVISQSYKGGKYVGPKAVLKDIERYLDRGKL